MTAQAGQRSAGNAAPADEADRSASRDEASRELALLLRRAGIEVPEDRWDAVVEEYISFLPHLALVNRTYRPDEEPSLVFAVRPASQTE